MYFNIFYTRIVVIINILHKIIAQNKKSVQILQYTLLSVICNLLSVVCYLLSVICCLLSVVCCVYLCYVRNIAIYCRCVVCVCIHSCFFMFFIACIAILPFGLCKCTPSPPNTHQRHAKSAPKNNFF